MMFTSWGALKLVSLSPGVLLFVTAVAAYVQ